MRESVQVEVGVELAVDARKQVQVEGRSHAERIVVRQDQLRGGLLEIAAQQERVTGLQDSSHLAEKLDAGRTVEIADCAAEEKDEEMLAVLASGSHFEEPVEVFALESDDADGIDVAEFAFAHGQRRGRNLNRTIGSVLVMRERFENPARFLAAAA